jgi:hypothetical protein
MPARPIPTGTGRQREGAADRSENRAEGTPTQRLREAELPVQEVRRANAPDRQQIIHADIKPLQPT